MAARKAADFVPVGPMLGKAPRNCGVSDTTVARLVPEPGGRAPRRQGGESSGECRWYTVDDGRAGCGTCAGDLRNERLLTVTVAFSTSRVQSPISDAMQMMDDQFGTGESPDPPSLVEGLGQEAVARYTAEAQNQGAHVVFRTGNAVATIRYRGRDKVRGELRPLPEKTAMDGALAAAAETADSLHTAARPVLSRVKHPVVPTLRHVPRPCDAVPAAVLDRVARGASRERGAPTLIAAARRPGTSSETCRWTARTSQSPGEGQSRTLTVAFLSEADRLPGLGAFTTTRRFLMAYQDQRAGRSREGRFSGFTPLAGPGDRAFAVTKVSTEGSIGDAGLVVFQKNNVLVEVSYRGDDEEKHMTGSRLVDSAYTVAVAVRKSLRP